MGVWSHIILEGYCMFKHLSEKIHKFCRQEDLFKKNKDIKWKTRKNKNYIPKNKRPRWCKTKNKKFVPQFNCLCDNKDKKCPFFAMCEADKKDYTLFNKFWKKEANKKIKGGK